MQGEVRIVDISVKRTGSVILGKLGELELDNIVDYKITTSADGTTEVDLKLVFTGEITEVAVSSASSK